MRSKIVVAAHKEFDFVPYSDCYSLIQVGSSQASTRLPFPLHDDEGDNISNKNSTYCELTALYWAWKNVHSDIKGLCHYRRYLAHHAHALNQEKNILTKKEIEAYLQKADLLTVKPEYRTLKFSWYPCEQDLQHDRPYIYTKKAVSELCPEYLPEVEKFYRSNKISPLNIIIAKSEFYNKYCEWLFPLAFRIEELLKQDGGVPSREIGFISERFLTIWIMHNHNKLNVRYFPITKIDEPKGVRSIVQILAERSGILHIIRLFRMLAEHISLKIQSLLGNEIKNPTEWVK